MDISDPIQLSERRSTVEIFETLKIGPVEIVFLIIGITQFVKEVFTLGGKEAKVLTFIVAFFLTGVAYSLGQGMIPKVATPYVELLAVALGGGLAGMGYYNLVFKGKGSTDLMRISGDTCCEGDRIRDTGCNQTAGY